MKGNFKATHYRGVHAVITGFEPGAFGVVTEKRTTWMSTQVAKD